MFLYINFYVSIKASLFVEARHTLHAKTYDCKALNQSVAVIFESGSLGVQGCTMIAASYRGGRRREVPSS